jgi:hypothetical protein
MFLRSARGDTVSYSDSHMQGMTLRQKYCLWWPSLSVPEGRAARMVANTDSTKESGHLAAKPSIILHSWTPGGQIKCRIAFVYFQSLKRSFMLITVLFLCKGSTNPDKNVYGFDIKILKYWTFFL